MLRDNCPIFGCPSTSLLHNAPKKTNNNNKLRDNWRPCCDYRTLKFVIITDRYPVSHIHDLLYVACIFIVLDWWNSIAKDLLLKKTFL